MPSCWGASSAPPRWLPRFRTSGVALGLSADGVTGRASVRNEAGHYEDVYVRTANGGWRFKSRSYVPDAPAAAREELREVPAVRLVRDVARFLRMEDQHIGLVELSLRRKRLGAGRARPARVQQRHPVLEEPRVIVRPWSVRLRAGPDEDPQPVLLCGRERGQRGQCDGEGEEDDVPVSLLITVLGETRLIDGVTTRVIEEREWEDGELLEVSWNYFAQAADGTVCYFGEDVDIFEDEQISHKGAWCADEAGSMPGIFMPADPQPGMTYQTEFGPGAQDQVKIVGSGPVTVPYGPFPETIRWREFNPLDGDKGYKVFAEGFGLVIDESLLLVDFEEDASAPGPPLPTDQSCGDVNG